MSCSYVVKMGAPVFSHEEKKWKRYPLRCDQQVKWRVVDGKRVYQKYCECHTTQMMEFSI